MTNVPPSGTDKTIALLEDGDHVFTAADFGFSDADGNALLAVEIATLPVAGDLLINGVAVTAGQFITVTDLNSGLLKFVPDPNGHGAGYASFAFQVQDDGGMASGGADLDPSANTITLDVTAVINGDGGDNGLSGTPEHELIDGKAGNDRLFGNVGGDTLIGGDGNDTFELGAFVPGGIIEASTAGSGIDTITSTVTRSLEPYANVENLTLMGTDAIAGTGNALANFLDGSQNSAANTLTGLGGNDTYLVGAGDTVVEALNDGLDSVESVVSFTLTANIENLTLLGSAAIGTGNTLANLLDGSQTSVANTLIGLGGDDVYIIGAGDAVVEAAGGGTDLVGSKVSYTLTDNVENLSIIGSATGISGTGNALANILNGTQNANANVLTGLGGNDSYFIGAGDSVVEAANGGMDTVNASVSYTLAANVENLILIGAAAVSGTGNGLANILNGLNAGQSAVANVLTGLGGNDIYVIGAGDSVVEALNGGTDSVDAYVSYTLAANVEELVLRGSAAISGIGNSLANRLDGLQNTSANLLQGLGGNDTYIVGAGDNVVEAAGGGTDLVGTVISYALTANVENLTLLGSNAIAGVGNNLANGLDGTQNSKANVLRGLAGNDTYFVGAGDVVIEAAGGGTSDVVRSLVNYTLGANVEHLVLISSVNQNGTGNTLANTIYGNAKNNVLSGGAGGDTLNGLAGNDTLIGGTGLDFLSGGLGSDLFVFNAAPAQANIDVISDFNHAADTFQLENSVMKTLGGVGWLKANFFFAGPGPHDFDDHIIYNRASGGLFYDDDGVGVHASIQIGYLANKPVLAANDFFVI